jgi:preprotein translocase subunit SecD
MIYFPRWKIILVYVVCALGIVYTIPNLIPRQDVDAWGEGLPSWLPTRQINLGLDLRGGSHLLLEVAWADVVRERLESLVDGLRSELRSADIGYTELGVAGTTATFRLRDASRADDAREILRTLDATIDVAIDGEGLVTAAFTEQALNELRDNAANQSIEIVRRRIDELGTNEPNIQRQGADRILVQLPGVDDPGRIKDLLGQTARLTFHLLDETVSPGDIAAGRLPPGTILLPSSEVLPSGQPEQMYPVRRRVTVSGDTLTNSAATFQQGQPVVSFKFDSVGARRFADATTENVGKRLAIVLDGKVISAPVIRSPIIAGDGIIEGGFTVQGANDLALLLRAGALPAPLTILEERTVGPGLGADSIAAGKTAAVIGFIGVVAFMVLTYGLFGVMACVALVFNIFLIFAALSVLQATLTLPGIAGIVLTMGMAVDANVLIFERIREEVGTGRSPISAIDAGFNRALTAITDSNLTTILAALVLFALGSGPVKGFAVTLTIGIVASMFTAIMVTRLMIVTWLKRTRAKAIPI